MIGWVILIIAAIGLAIWLSMEVRDEEKLENNSYSTVYASEISRKRSKPKKKKRAKKSS